MSSARRTSSPSTSVDLERRADAAPGHRRPGSGWSPRRQILPVAAAPAPRPTSTPTRRSGRVTRRGSARRAVAAPAPSGGAGRSPPRRDEARGGPRCPPPAASPARPPWPRPRRVLAGRPNDRGVLARAVAAAARRGRRGPGRRARAACGRRRAPRGAARADAAASARSPSATSLRMCDDETVSPPAPRAIEVDPPGLEAERSPIDRSSSTSPRWPWPKRKFAPTTTRRAPSSPRSTSVTKSSARSAARASSKARTTTSSRRRSATARPCGRGR